MGIGGRAVPCRFSFFMLKYSLSRNCIEVYVRRTVIQSTVLKKIT